MASHGAPPYGAPPGPGQPAAQYLPYRPAPLQQQDHQQQGQQQQQQQQQQQANPSQHPHPGAAHGFQPYQQPQHVPQHHYQPLPPPQDAAGHMTPATAAMSTDGMVPAPLRLQRKPIAGQGVAHEAQQPPNQPSSHFQPGYFSPPTPSPTPYAAGAGTQGSSYQAFSPAPGSPTPPASQQWHPAQGRTVPGQPTPPASHGMQGPPLYPPSNAFFGGSTTADFIAELPAEPVGYSGNQAASAPQPGRSPLAEVAQEKSDPPGAAQGSQVAELGPAADANADSSSQTVKDEPTAIPREDNQPGSAPPAADSDGLIPVEKPGPPDHEGLIPFEAALPGAVPYMYPGFGGSSPSHPQQPQPSPQQPQPDPSGQAPFHPTPSAAAQAPQGTQQNQPVRPPTSPYPQTTANATSPHHWPGHPTSPPTTYPPPNHPSPQQPSVTSATGSPYQPQVPTPATQPPSGPYHPPATPTPPPASPHPSYHSATFPIAHTHSQSHSPSPSIQGAQAAGPQVPPASPNPQQPSFASPPPQTHTPAAATYTPAAFPAKPHATPAQATSFGPPHAGTFPPTQPSAIPSTPSVTYSNHGFSAPPQPPASKPGKHAGASSSFGGFANSVFSKDTVKWSKKTASRLGGAIKSAATTAHAAAANAQTAAVQAAALRRQQSVLAAQMKASSTAAGYAPGMSGAPQPATVGQTQTWPGAGPPGAPAAHPAQTGMPPGAGGLVHPSPQGPVPPTWSPAPPASGPGPSVSPAQAAPLPQQGHFQMPPQSPVLPPAGYPQGLPGPGPQPGVQQHPQPWQPSVSGGATAGNLPGAPVPTPGPGPSTGAGVRPSQAAAAPPTGPYAPVQPYQQTQSGVPVPGAQAIAQGQFPQVQTPPQVQAPPQVQHQHSESWLSGTVAAPIAGNMPSASCIGTEQEKTQQSKPPQQPATSPSPEKAQKGQSSQVNTPAQALVTPASNQGSVSGEAVPTNGAGEAGQSSQVAQTQPVSPAPSLQGSEARPPQPEGSLSPGYQLGQPAPPNHSLAAPAPGPVAQHVAGGQAPHPKQQQITNTVNQQPLWNPAHGATSLAPMPTGAAGGHVPPVQPTQQQWGGAGHGQTWSPQPPGAPAPVPGPNAYAYPGTGVPPAQQGTGYQAPQYAPVQPHPPQGPGQHAQPWAAPVPSYPSPAPGPVPGQPPAGWQQPPPQWNVPAQQQAWGHSPPQGMPPYPQPHHGQQQQPIPQWNPAVQPPQPWSQPPGAAPSASPPFQYAAGPGQPLYASAPAHQPVQYPPQGTQAYPNGYGTVTPQPQWQASSPYPQGPASFQSQVAPPPPQNSMPHPVNMNGAGSVQHHGPVPSSPGHMQGASPSGPQQGAHPEVSTAPVAAPAGETAASAANSQPACGDAAQGAAGSAAAAGAGSPGQSGSARGDSGKQRDEPTAQAEGNSSETDLKRHEGDISTSAKSNEAQGLETNGGSGNMKPTVESQYSSSTSPPASDQVAKQMQGNDATAA